MKITINKNPNVADTFSKDDQTNFFHPRHSYNVTLMLLLPEVGFISPFLEYRHPYFK